MRRASTLTAVAGEYLLVLVFSAMSAGAAEVVAPSPFVALQAEDFDFGASKAFVDGKPVAGEFKSAILSTLGLRRDQPWSVGRKEEGQTRDYLIAFARPVGIGSILCTHAGTYKYLKKDAAYPPEIARAGDWETVIFPPSQSGWRLATLPPGTTTRAILCHLESAWWYEWHRFEMVRLLAPRLHNVVPEALANGEAEYISYGDLRPPIPFLASNIVRGTGAWQSHGPDNQGKNYRPPVSEFDPTWFTISWDAPQTICGVLVQSNFKKFDLLAYRGAAGVNPAVAPEKDWKRLKCSIREDGRARWLSFAPVTTRGLKFLATEASDRYGAIEGLQAFVDLKDGPVPPRRAVSAEPPFKIPFTVPADGTLSMAIEGPDGRRVRNMIVREERKGGRYEQGWDLKDEAGRFVEPGTYKWKVLWHPGLQLKYQMTPYPNIEANAPENSPWLNGASGPGGWLADHTPPSAGCAVGDRIFFAAPCAESGVALIECDLDGRKLWGHHNLAAWTGPGILASDGKALYAAPWNWNNGTDTVWRFTLPEKKLDTLLQINPTPTRFRGIRGMAARDGKLYLSVSGGSSSLLEGAATASDVDLDNCEPRYAQAKGGGKPDAPDPRSDFLRLFRLTWTPPGCNGLIYLETAKSPAPRQHIVLAFNKPVPIGSFVFPLPEEKDLVMHISVLKPDGSYPPVPGREKDWNRVWKGTGKGWMVIPAPDKTETRAIRLSFDKGLDELEETELEEESPGDIEKATESDQGSKKPAWRAQLEGMKLLRHRFKNLFPTCRVKVSSGTVTPEGEWDAQRSLPLTSDDPGIYMMEWDTPQAIRGLAIKEIDGRFTEIDAWLGEGTPDMKADKGWEKVARYEQPLRYYYSPDQGHNSSARYIDGYVDFGREVKTRALRLRVVEQWMWKEEDRAGCVGVRRDRGGETLDPTRCRIYGVAPLQYLGGDTPADTSTFARVEAYDIETRKLIVEQPLPGAGDLALDPKGNLYACANGKVWKVDMEGGRHTPLDLDVKEPWAITCDRAGKLFVFDGATDLRVVKVFEPSGKLLRTIGTPGVQTAGPYDPNHLTGTPWSAVDITVDSRDQLWVVVCEYNPKRISRWGADGKFQKDFLGNTSYGGGGCLDPYDKSRLFLGPMEFAIDWQTGATRLKNITWTGDSPAGEVPIRIADRLYLVTRPLFLSQAVGVVYRYEKDHARRVAAVGRAGNFPPLRVPDILRKLGKKAIGYCTFAWSDKNGDGNPQADEVDFFDAERGEGSVGRFEETLAIDAGKYRYEVKEFLPNGAPLYERKRKPFDDGAIRMSNGQFFVVGNGEHMAALTPDGKTVWTHPTEGWGVHALYSAKPWFPGQTVAQFGIVGHETAPVGDLGEFFVTHSNTGAWHIWSSDGLLAGRIFRDMRGPGARPWSMAEHQRGLDLTEVTAGQEHFNGYFCRTREDNRYYVVAGHNHASVVEVVGIEQFRRFQGDVKVTPDDVQAAIEWDRRTQARKLYEAAKVIDCRQVRKEVTVDGDPKEWEVESARLPNRDVTFAMAHDETNLYLCYRVNGAGPIKNTGNDWHRLFKTGAAVDFQIGVDPKAPADRKEPAPGDLRLLMTVVNDKPIAVLYQPNCPGAKPEEAWETHTMVFKAAFDRVVQAPDVKLAARGDADKYCVEAAVPLKLIGLTIDPDVCLKMDWGILVSGPDGTEVLQRLYWANQQTAIVSDEAAEASLQPDLWGVVRFSTGAAKRDQPDIDIEKGGTPPADTEEPSIEED